MEDIHYNLIDIHYNLIEKGDSVHWYDEDGQHIGVVVGFKSNEIVVVEYHDICYDLPAKKL